MWRWGFKGLWFSAIWLLSSSLFAADTTVIKIATLTPDGSAWMKQMRAGAEVISQRTSGRVSFKFYPGGVMGDDKAVMRKIRIGQLQGAALTAGAFETIYPDSQIYNLPLIFSSYEQVDAVRKQIDPLLIKGFMDKGFVTFGFAEGGFAYPMTSGKDIVTPADYSGHKVWIPNDDAMSEVAYASIQVTPIPLALGDVLTGMQTGLIDTIAAPPGPAIVMQWHTQVKSMTNIPISYIYGLMAIDKKVFEKLSASDQKIVTDEMTKVFVSLDKLNRSDSLKAFDAMKQQGIRIVAPTEAERSAWQKMSHTLQKQMLEKGVVSKEIHATLHKHLK